MNKIVGIYVNDIECGNNYLRNLLLGSQSHYNLKIKPDGWEGKADGITYKVLKASIASRGHKICGAFISNSVDGDTYNRVILPSIVEDEYILAFFNEEKYKDCNND